MKQVTLITDGACFNNPGPGGWAYILRYGQASIERAGGIPDTTNNRMEIQAAIEGLKALREPCEVLLISDSQYMLDGITSWRHKWRVNGWTRRRKATTYPLANSDLWEELDQLATTHIVRGQWIKGHSGHLDNERCDQLAAAQASLQVDMPSWSSLIDKAA